MAISSYSSDRQESVHKRGLRCRQPLVDADRRGLTCSILGHHPSRKRPGNVEMSRRETTTDRVEKMPSCSRDDSGGQRLEADFMNEVRDVLLRDRSGPMPIVIKDVRPDFGSEGAVGEDEDLAVAVATLGMGECRLDVVYRIGAVDRRRQCAVADLGGEVGVDPPHLFAGSFG
jgi:hypothetical protein